MSGKFNINVAVMFSDE